MAAVERGTKRKSLLKETERLRWTQGSLRISEYARAVRRYVLKWLISFGTPAR
jgi:hypothetical protein